MLSMKNFLLPALAGVLLVCACDNPFSPETMNANYKGESFSPSGSSITNAVTISTGGSSSLTLVSDEEHWSKVFLSSGYSYIISTSGSAPLELYVYSDVSYTSAGYEGSSAGSSLSITVTPASSGYYYINTNGYYTYSTGYYTLSVSSGSSVSVGGDSYDPADDVYTGATLVGIGSSSSRTLLAAEYDWFKVSLSGGYAYTFQTTGSLDDHLYLYATDGSTEIKNNDDDGVDYNGLITDTIPTSGTYYLKVEGNSTSTTGAYALLISSGSSVSVAGDSYDPADDIVSGASTISTGGTQSHTLVADEYDWARVYLNSGYTYTVSVATAAPMALYVYSDTVGYLCADSARSTSGANLSATVTPASSGYFFIQTFGNLSTTTGSYTLSVSSGTTVAIGDSYDPADDVYTGATLVGISSSSSRILLSGEYDWFKVNLTAGSADTFQTTGSLDMYLELYAGDGTTLITTDDDGAATGTNALIAFAPTTSGVYYIKVKGLNSSYSGSYGFEVSGVVANLNLITASAATWAGFVTDGAAGSTGTLSASGGTVSGTYIIPDSSSGLLYPFYEIDAGSPKTFTGMTALTVTYMCDHDVGVILGDFLGVLPASPATYATVTVSNAEFFDMSGLSAVFDPSLISGAALVPNIYNASGTLSISRFELTGVAP